MDINAPMTEERLTHYREAKRLIESPTLNEVFKTLKEAYLAAWENSDRNSDGSPRTLEEATGHRGTLWVKVKVLEDLQYELNSYAGRAEVAEMAGRQ